MSSANLVVKSPFDGMPRLFPATFVVGENGFSVSSAQPDEAGSRDRDWGAAA
jgi:hypothetical protein